MRAPHCPSESRVPCRADKALGILPPLRLRPSPVALLALRAWPLSPLCCYSDTLSLLLPQELCTCCFLHLEALRLGMYVIYFLTSSRSLLSCHFLRGIFIKHLSLKKSIHLPSPLQLSLSLCPGPALFFFRAFSSYHK